jgi:beta-glucosidase
LLQNKDNLLPLAHHTKIALIGDFGRDHPRYQGMGSSQVTTECVLTAYEEVFRYTQALFATGYHYDDEHPEEVDTSLLQEAVAVAQQAEVVLLFVGLPEIMESEAFDRPHLGLPAQHNALVTEICKIHGKVVVVLSNGGPVELPWADLPQAILEGYLLGEAGAAAVVDLVFGQVSPSGRLAETFPLRQRDVLADRYFPGTQERVEYREGLNVGYRYFDTAKVPVRFPFGHGLTYTTFEYADLQILSIDVSKTEVKLSLALSNTGLVEASEVVQCYIHPMNSQVYRPEHELKAYSKIFARPGCSVRVAFSLSREAFSFYDVGVGDWVVENGAYEIRIGASSRDIRLHSLITLETGETASELAISTHPPLSQETAAHLTDHVKDEDFYRRFRTAFDSGPGVDPRSTGIRSITPFHQSTLLKDLARRRLLGRLLLWIAYKGASADVKPGTSHDRQKRLARVAVENIPLRTLVLFSRGGMSYELLDAFLALMNRQWCGALWKFRVAFTPFRK